MFTRKTLLTLLFLFPLVFVQPQMVQSGYVNGKPVLTGTWKSVDIEYVAGEIQLKIKPGADRNLMDSLLGAHGCFLIHDFGESRWGLVGCDTTANIFDRIDGFLASPLVEYAEPNGIVYLAVTPNDTYFDSLQWSLNNTGDTIRWPPWYLVTAEDADIDAIEAWDLDTGNTAVLVAVLDTGIPTDSINTDSLVHPDLKDAGKYLLGWNFLDSTDNVRDESGHGTAVTGILAAMTNNNEGIAGVCWGCKILVELIQRGQEGTVEALSEGIRHAVRNGAKIMNISAGNWAWSSQNLEDAVAEAEDSSCLIAAAAGNCSCDDPLFPAGYASYGTDSCHLNGYRNVIAVAGTDSKDEWWNGSSYSNDSLRITLSAPGARIFSTLPPYPSEGNGENTYYGCIWSFCEGTSLSSPIVAGLAGLLLSHDSTLKADSIRTIIENTADDVGSLGWDIYTGFGRVNALRALLALDDYYPNATGYLRTNATWGDTLGNTIYVLGDVVVPVGCTLTIDQGAVVKFLTNDREDFGSDSTKCEIIVKGKLIVNGTANDSVHLISSSENPLVSDWYGIRVDSLGSARLSYCNIEHAYTGVKVKRGASVKLNNCNIKHVYTGIYFSNSANDSVIGCTFRDNFMYGIFDSTNNYLFVDDCLFLDSTPANDSGFYGILCRTNMTIKNSFFQGYQYGIKVCGQTRTSGSAPLIEECGFYDLGLVGILSTSTSNPTIQKCCFKGSYGNSCINIQGGNPYIKQCYMASQGDGIHIGMLFTLGAAGKIRQSSIWDYNSTAVQIVGTTTHPDFGTSDSGGCNWFQEPDSGEFYFWSSSSDTIKAKYNFWDRTDTTTIRPDIYGNVDIDPVLGPCGACGPYYAALCETLPPSDPVINPCKLAAGDQEKRPKYFSLSQNYPNPFNPQTVIRYSIPEFCHVQVTIYNILGQKVRTLVDEDHGPGCKTIFWEGKNGQGEEIASGIYFYRIKAGNFNDVKRMVLLR